jgi:hypothetical protein
MWTELVGDLQATIRAAVDHGNGREDEQGSEDNEAATNESGQADEQTL